MTKENLITAEVGTTLDEAAQILQKYRIEKLPLVDENNILKGLITSASPKRRKNVLKNSSQQVWMHLSSIRPMAIREVCSKRFVMSVITSLTSH